MMTQRNAELLLASVILARSASFLFTKIGMQSIGIFNLLGVRFTLAFLLLACLFWRRLLHCGTRTILRGMLLGAAFFSTMTAELMGLRTTSTSTTAFLENTAVVFVPLFEAVLHRQFPDHRTLLNAGVASLGIALLTLQSSLSLTTGEAFCILAAVLYAMSIILTDRLSKRDDALMLGILQVGFIGLFAILAAFIFETPRLPSGGTEWGLILALAVVCTGFGFTLQPVAQNGTTSERAGLFCALNPVFATLLGVIFLHEQLGFRGIVGAVLVLSAVTFSRVSWEDLKKQPRPAPCKCEHTAGKKGCEH